MGYCRRSSKLVTDFFSFPDDYDRVMSLNDLTFGIKTNIPYIYMKVEIVEKVDPLNRYKTTVI